MPWAQVECHSLVRNALVRSIEKGMLDTTHLIYGPSGAGQEGVARAIAMTVNCAETAHDFCGVCRNCRRIQERMFPDVFELRPDEDWSKPERKGREFSIGHMREVQRIAQAHPYESEKKIFLIHQAHQMTDEAANCLLKTLEEPQSHSLFLLLSDNLSAILPTILSRCRKVRLLPLETEALAEKLRGQGLPEDRAETIARAAGGLYERAQALWKDGYLEERDEMLGLLQKIRRSPSAAVETVDPLVKEKDRLRDRLVILLNLLRDGLVALDGGAGPLLNPDKRGEIEDLWKGARADTLIQGAEKVSETLEGLDRNVNPALLLTDFFLALQR